MSPPEPMRPALSVILPARNEADHVEAALRSLAAQHDDPAGRGQLEAIVVDNGSTDDTAAVTERAAGSLAAGWVRVLSDPRPGRTRAKNIGARAARAPYLLFLDADSRASPALVTSILARAERGEVGASIRVRADRADGADTLDRAFFDLMEYGKRLFAIRANMLWCRRDVFEALGGFDERLNHAEDLEFLRRAGRAGHRVGHVTEAWIVTSPRRLHTRPAHLGMLTMFGRWTLGHFGIGRRWPY